LENDQTLAYAGRGFAAAPAVGSAQLHAKEQAELVEEALLTK
jgi:2-oxoglutarate dehydrogenase E1 component